MIDSVNEQSLPTKSLDSGEPLSNSSFSLSGLRSLCGAFFGVILFAKGDLTLFRKEKEKRKNNILK
jgi:hypothetical protein